MMKHSALILLLLFAILIALPGCDIDEREFLPDIVVPLEDHPGQIVIKEWRWLLGSGAEIYYQLDGKVTFLGSIAGGDDGYCAFADGKYSLQTEADTLTVRWVFQSDAGDIWREKQFTLPGEAL